MAHIVFQFQFLNYNLWWSRFSLLIEVFMAPGKKKVQNMEQGVGLEYMKSKIIAPCLFLKCTFNYKCVVTHMCIRLNILKCLLLAFHMHILMLNDNSGNILSLFMIMISEKALSSSIFFASTKGGWKSCLYHFHMFIQELLPFTGSPQEQNVVVRKAKAERKPTPTG